MTHAEQYSTSEPSAPPAPRRTPRKQVPTTRKRVFTTLALAASIGTASAVISLARPASADQLSDAKAQAAAITAKIQADQAQISALSGQVQAADYHLSQLNSEIAANQAEVTKDQAEVTKDHGQLRTQAIADYTDSGTSNQVTQMFSSNINTSDIRSEYSAIATGNVTTTIDNLHTAQAKLQATQSALDQQQSQATTTRDTLQSSENQATSLANQDQATLNSVDSTIQNLIAQQQAAAAAAAKAAATAAFNAKLAASQQAQAAAQNASTMRGLRHSIGYHRLVHPATSGAGRGQRGHPGGREPGRRTLRVGWRDSPRAGTSGGFDCSGLVQWSFAQAGISLPRTSGAQYAATTHIPLADIEPGDLLFYGADGSEHVALYIGGGSMIEAPFTGAVVWVTAVRTGDGFAGVGRVG